uniref:Uncharacterized protein n=1 Tax=Aureoumbra lagunensis TaxID=44058 RepID=A0A7S3JXB5_9STRA|mmetsp:Transcript_23773/g.30937  ORF Transcript_23773/g.30937 Transcript_23773/m.30937 type:complete len:104 (+) Transcript_23773:26-337(+)|eukprot:CAMPEP_0197288700 /NCGR_PEP_ID=MMETSP0890-20130614/5862_1 /TAXON_ID=44058 ORGANISM="Aureoumbra lagunensis, Strain CCMP1510" /NCGR_SAMPLE_ID=MMETSP0890 /ASSEMBLY_ACC=CAM_ASM_000533 /LENGTH=103 /DNA_ID=CAMNT_0042759623 /DNA_START=1 /DNA_END=312 /DNA_ORIENTATION=-
MKVKEGKNEYTTTDYYKKQKDTFLKEPRKLCEKRKEGIKYHYELYDQAKNISLSIIKKKERKINDLKKKAMDIEKASMETRNEKEALLKKMELFKQQKRDKKK